MSRIAAKERTTSVEPTFPLKQKEKSGTYGDRVSQCGGTRAKELCLQEIFLLVSPELDRNYDSAKRSAYAWPATKNA